MVCCVGRRTDLLFCLKMLSQKIYMPGSQTDDLKREVFRLQKDLLQGKKSLFCTILFSRFERPLTLISVFNIVYFTLNIFIEKTKVKALSEELENPMNVHRWRKLEGSDPATYEMIQKIQTLQKRLIMKTEEVVEKDLLIQEKEKLYV